ncbi:MAG: precorrin-6y C5,15-methyltransferase (decarboxylating) subunit CbiE [Micromonosporaceae bacterium]
MGPAITVIGCDGGPLSSPAADALAAARCVAGAPRHLAEAALPPGADRIVIGRIDAALDAIFAHPGPVAVLASGDPGFFGIVRVLAARGAAPAVIPAVSSVALAFARLGMPWDDALVLSAHGRDPRPVLAAALGCGKAAILTAPGPDAGPHSFIPALLAAGRSVYVAERLGGPGERLTNVSGGDVTDCFADPNLVITFEPQPHMNTDGPSGVAYEHRWAIGATSSAPGPSSTGPRWMAGHPGAPGGWALTEDAFAHRDSMITKAEVRALVLARLGPGPGRTIWDIGAGSGSVAVECARFGAHVIAVEADPAQCACIRANAAAHGVGVQVTQGRAPQALTGLLPADAVFVGGGDDTVLAAVLATRPLRVVVGLASVDRVRGVRDLLTEQGYDAEGTALQASRLASLPSGSVRLSAANPVFVLWGDRA